MTTDEKFDLILSRLDKVDSRLDKVDSRLDKVDSRLDKVDSRLDNLETRFDNLENKVSCLQGDVSVLKDDVSNIKCILEGETNKNIKVIAEAHLDNNRHTHEAENIAKEVKFSQEIFGIRLNMLEGTVDRLKKAVGMD